MPTPTPPPTPTQTRIRLRPRLRLLITRCHGWFTAQREEEMKRDREVVLLRWSCTNIHFHKPNYNSHKFNNHTNQMHIHNIINVIKLYTQFAAKIEEEKKREKEEKRCYPGCPVQKQTKSELMKHSPKVRCPGMSFYQLFQFFQILRFLTIFT